MITPDINIDQSELSFINGRWCQTNNCYGTSPEVAFGGKVNRTVITEAASSYCMYYDDMCFDVIMYRVNGKWGLLLKSKILGMGCANFQSVDSTPFRYDNFYYLVSNDMETNHTGHESVDYSKIRGYIAVQQDRRWGVVKIYKQEWAVIQAKEIIPCKYYTIEAAAAHIPDLSETEKANIAKGIEYQFSTDQDYADKLRRKIKGWYASKFYEEMAIDRIMRLRSEIVQYLSSVSTIPTDKLIKYLDKSGFYYRPSSARGHHNYPGGLAEHSLGMYFLLREWISYIPIQRSNLPLFSFIVNQHPLYGDILQSQSDSDAALVASIGHDLCKAERFYFDGRNIRQHHETDTHHSSLSAKRLEQLGITNSKFPDILRAVRTHMHLFTEKGNSFELKDRSIGRQSPLCVLLWTADKINASRPHARKARH